MEFHEVRCEKRLSKMLSLPKKTLPFIVCGETGGLGLSIRSQQSLRIIISYGDYLIFLLKI